MPLETNLNVSPYYDDFSEDKNYHRVLFRPGVAVQARELNQLQTILQNQFERFGDNIFKVGTIIKGCVITLDTYYKYIKIKDNQNDGAPVALGLYANNLVVQESSNLQSIVVNYIAGFESQDPNLNTLYIKYLNTGTSGQKDYVAGQTLKVFDAARTVEDVIILNGGTLYSNSDTVVFSGGSGSGATATVTTDASGTITDVSVTTKGTGYTSVPNVSITTSTGASASLLAKNYIAEITVANTSNAVGTGVAALTTDGVIYQKGHFVRVDKQETIVEKYSSTPSDKVIGFTVTESIVNSNFDSALLDNATGTPNFNAPGANRFKLTPVLTAMTYDEAQAQTNPMLALLEIKQGVVVRDRLMTEFNMVNKLMARRTFEESGNYVTDYISLDTETANTTHFNLIVGPGKAYINGERIWSLNTIRVPVQKANTTVTIPNQTINTQYGSFLYVKEMLGKFPIKTGTTVYLNSTAATDVFDNAGGTPSNPGTAIGTAKIRSLTYDSGIPGLPSAVYKLYIFDVRMNPGYSIRQVRSVGINSTAVADVVLDGSGNAKLEDINNDILVFNTGAKALQQLDTEEFVYRTTSTDTFNSSGESTITVNGAIPYGTGSLNDTQLEDFILIPDTTLTPSADAAGTVSVTGGSSNVVTGVSTEFLSTLSVGDYIKFSGNSNPYVVTAIASNTSLTIAGNTTTLSGLTLSANTYKKVYPANVPIDLRKINNVVTVSSGVSNTIAIDLGNTFTSTSTFSLYHDIQLNTPSIRAKSISTYYVKLSTDKLANTTTGPWCLGIPDALSVEAVYIGSSNAYSENTVSYHAEFELDSGQRDNYYGLSYLKKSPGSSISLTATNNLLVKVKAFTTGIGSYISAESYPVDDSTTPLPANKIRTENIPIYISSTYGGAFSLRDCIDFRPIVVNTAILSTNAASASIDPPTTEAFDSTDKKFPSPTRSFEASILSYVPRIDRITMNRDGDIEVIKGIPSTKPLPPAPGVNTMDMGFLNIAPYPSLSSKAAIQSKRFDLKNTIDIFQTRRYTMSDIKSLEERIQRLEYNTLLNALEANAATLSIKSENNSSIEVFKNGFFVDSFDTYLVANIDDLEFNASIDTSRSRLMPREELQAIDIEYDSTNSSGVVKTGDIVTLPYSEVTYVSQPIANKERTLVERLWSFRGKMIVTPKVDNFFDSEVTGTSAVTIDIAEPVTQLVNALNPIIANQTAASAVIGTNVNLTSSTTNDGNWETTNFTQTTTNTILDSHTKIVLPPAVTSKVEVNNLLKSVYVNPMVRAQRIGVFAAGLRPGAQHYVFFDNVDLSNNITPCTLTNLNNPTPRDFVPISNKEGSKNLFANSIGSVAFLLDIPGDTFTAGEKDILVMDVSTLLSETSATSKAISKFVSFSTSGFSENLTISTKTFDFAGVGFQAKTFEDKRTVSTTTAWSSSTFIGDTGVTAFGCGGACGGGCGGDPLAQTFTVQKWKGSDYIFITSVDVYFKAKDLEKGVTVEIREVADTGFVTNFILPFSRTYKKSSEVTVSSDASVATKFTFSTPLCLRADKEYAIVIFPDGNSPNYRVWTAATGEPDITNNSISHMGWTLGTMFYSTSGRTFTAVQDEELKFKVNRAQFSGTTGTVVLNNKNYEFLTVNTVSGSFRGGEDVAQMSNTYLNVTLSANSNTYIVNTNTSLTSTISINDKLLFIYGTANVAGPANVIVSTTTVSNTTANAGFDTLQVGGFIRLGSEVRQITAIANSNSLSIDAPFNSTYTNNLYYNVTPKFDVVTVNNIDATSITLNKPILFHSNTSVGISAQKVVGGIVSSYVASKNKLHIIDSNSSNSTFLIRASNNSYLGYLVGDQSDALAKVTSINNVNATAMTPFLNAIQLPGTNLNYSVDLVKLSGGTVTDKEMSLSGKSRLDINDVAIVKSTSNEASGAAIDKSLTTKLVLQSNLTDCSPYIDVNPSSVLLHEYIISNDSTGENTRYGNAQAKYVSKRIELADGLDAEDVRVYLKAYRPAGTEIKVYAKFLDSADNEPFNDKDWSPLTLRTASNLFSTTYNESDMREYEYGLPLTPEATIIAGVATTNSAAGNVTLTAVGSTFTTDLTSSDLLKIKYGVLESDFEIIPISSITNNNTLVLTATPSSSSTTATLQKVTKKNQAYKNNKNSNIIRYFDSKSGAHDKYKFLAIKIVMLSQNKYVVPAVDDIRCMAISV